MQHTALSSVTNASSMKSIFLTFNEYCLVVTLKDAKVMEVSPERKPINLDVTALEATSFVTKKEI